MKWYYTQNEDFVNHPINKTFHEVVTMDLPTFKAWVEELKDVILQFWDKGNPPRLGFSDDEMVQQVHELRNYDLSKLCVSEDGSTEKDIFKTSTRVGNFVNQFFPTMYKTRIDNDKSIYDYFKKYSLKDSRYLKCQRHFKKDGFYVYSQIVRALKGEAMTNPENFLYSVDPKDPGDWIKKFEYQYRNSMPNTLYDYWLCPVHVKKNSLEYTGNAITKFNDVRSLVLTPEDVAKLPIPEQCLRTAKMVENNIRKVKDGVLGYHIRLYRKDTKIFPLGFKSIRMSYSQYAVNFPPVIAKAIYEKFVPENGIAWDCSAGWGGRIAGALTTSKPIVYIGNDPNTDHRTTQGRSKYHEVADYILSHTKENRKYEIYERGSEDMKDEPEFQKYKGKIDLVFTSPPYFCKEVYSEDPTQSAIKFSSYQTWLDGFLRPTLETAYNWLKPGGTIVLNIADVNIGSKTYPLEADAVNILKSLGFKEEPKFRICMQAMQGSGRHEIDKETGISTRNTYNHPCQIGGKPYKFEYLFVFKKVG